MHRLLPCQCHDPHRCLKASTCPYCEEVWGPPIPFLWPGPPYLSQVCLTGLVSVTLVPLLTMFSWGECLHVPPSEMNLQPRDGSRCLNDWRTLVLGLSPLTPPPFLAHLPPICQSPVSCLHCLAPSSPPELSVLQLPLSNAFLFSILQGSRRRVCEISISGRASDAVTLISIES